MYIMQLFLIKTILLILITIIISSIYAILVNQNYENIYKQIPKKIKTNAIITSEGQETEYYHAYQIKVENRRFILYVKKSWSQKLKYGMKIRLEGTYSKPQEARNHKGFSYKEYLKTKKICGSIKADNLQVINENSVNVILKCSNNIRNKIIKTIKQLFPIKISSLLTGILIGEKDEVPEEIRENFSNIRNTCFLYYNRNKLLISKKQDVKKRNTYCNHYFTNTIYVHNTI